MVRDRTAATTAAGGVILGLAYPVLVLSAVTIGWGLLTAALDKPPGKAQLLFAAGLELLVVVQSAVAGVRLAVGAPALGLATTVGYLVAVVVIVPIAWLWANSERTRFSGVVMAVAGLAVLAMTLRLLDLMPA